ncbi:MAG: hypothetical protein K9H16_11550 [Bacteroidales bacterium]|nr:hypothetical protein [Bacteroidales bacterium]
MKHFYVKMIRKTALSSGLILLFAATLQSQHVSLSPNTCFYIQAGTTADVSSGNLIVESGATGDASLIEKGALTFSGAGHAVVQRYLTNVSWHLVSSPVNAATAGMFLGDYLQLFNESDNSWSDISLTGYELNVMQGYALWSTAGVATTELFEGITTTGNQEFDFTFYGLDNGFNLIGNPYPCQIDWNEVTIPDHLGAAFWVFDPKLGDEGDYRYYIEGGGPANTTSQYIPSGQGFFVRAADAGGKLTFTDNIRCHGGQAFLKSDNNTTMLILKVSGNGYSTQTTIRFMEDASQDFDRLLDVDVMWGTSKDVPHLCAVAGNRKLAINSLPAFYGNETVPLSFLAGLNGDYKITVSGLDSFENEVEIILKDLLNQTETNLRITPEYTFVYDTSSVHDFRVQFKGINDIAEPDSTTDDWVNTYAATGNLHVDFTNPEYFNGSRHAVILVSDITGRTLFANNTTSASNVIRLPDNCKICIVRIISGNFTTSAKIINHF